MILQPREKPKSKGKVCYYFDKFICEKKDSCADSKLKSKCDTYPENKVQMDRVQIGARMKDRVFFYYAKRGELMLWGIIIW